MQTADSWVADNTSTNNYLYNAASELNESTNNYQTFFRDYDPALGRMTGIDIMAGKYSSVSPYNYAFNDPIGLNDPSGAEPYGYNKTGWYFENGDWYDNRPPMYWQSNVTNEGMLFGDFVPGGAMDWGNGVRSGPANWAVMNPSTFNARYGVDQSDVIVKNGELYVPVTRSAYTEYPDAIDETSLLQVTWLMTLKDAKSKGLLSDKNGGGPGDGLSKYLPVALMWGLDGDFVVGAGSEGTLGFGVILRGPDAGEWFGFIDGTSIGPTAVGKDISASLEGTYIFYSGNVDKFNLDLLEGYRKELSISYSQLIEIGLNSFTGSPNEADNGARVFGIGGAIGIGLPGPGWNFNFGETVIWK